MNANGVGPGDSTPVIKTLENNPLVITLSDSKNAVRILALPVSKAE
jgi:hypothetical protein